MVMKQVVRKKVDKIHALFSFESLESIENESFEEQNPAPVVRNNEYLPHENVEPMSLEFGGMLEFNFDYHSFATQQNGIRSHKYATQRAISMTHNNQLSPMNDDALSIPTNDSDMEWKEEKKCHFKYHKHYWDVVKDLVVQEGFELRKVKHASSRITTICRAKGCKWRIHVSKSPDGREFVIKTYNPEHNCQCVVKNRTVTTRWIAKKLHRSFARNPEMSVEKMRVELRDHFGVEATTDSHGQLDGKLEGI
ncbi:hypothetical protein G4B88_000214 [Cannabis sativa]|uniref:Transposase MuDR plant domain-containing protein n=1 Tax=Cannabis sativa TaxID=3483 RepID=A0A7J6GPY2_CANSA|nr:hypothetical protein G4B88_000214 [Cannabis sativa]